MDNWQPKRVSSSLRKGLLWGICIGLTISIAITIHFLNKDISSSINNFCVGINLVCNFHNGSNDASPTPIPTQDSSSIRPKQSAIPYLPGQGILVMSDDLQGTHNVYNWEVVTKRGGTCRFENDIYQDDAGADLLNSCVAQSEDMTNFAFEVHMHLTSAASAGIAFGVNRSRGALYYFAIDKSGHYALKVRSSQNGDFAMLASGATPIDSSSLVIAITVQNKTIRAYVNNNLVLTVTSDIYAHGLIGVLSYCGRADFTSARAWSLQ